MTRDAIERGARHRLGRVHRRVRGGGAPAPRATRSSASTTTRSTGRSAKSYDDDPRYTLVEGDAHDVALLTDAADRLRPLHRRRRDDRRDLVLPLLRLRPPRHQRADHRRVLRRRDRRAPRGRLQKVTYLSSSMVFESPTVGRRTRGRSARSRRRSRPTGSRSSRWSTSPAPRTSSTACRTRSCARSTASASARCGRKTDIEVAERQREARDEPRRARPRAEDREGPGPAAHPGRRHPGSALHVRRRPRPRHRHRHGAPGGAQRRLQPLDRGVDDGARARREHLAAAPGRRRPFRYVSDDPFEHDVQKRVPSVEKAGRCSASRPTTTLDEMLDEVVPWVVDAVGRGIDLAHDRQPEVLARAAADRARARSRSASAT